MYLKMLHGLIKGRRGMPAAHRCPLDDGLGFTIRFGYPDDDEAVRLLAALDSQPVPAGPLLVAEVAGELWAAVTLAGAPQAIADPFRHTAGLVAILHQREERLTRHGRRPIARRPAGTVVYS